MPKPPEIEFNPRAAFLFKNVGPDCEDVFLVPSGVEDAIRDVIREQRFNLEFFLANYLLDHPGVGPGDLEFEHCPGSSGESGKHVIRRRGQGVIYETPDLNIKVVGEPG